MGSVCSAAHNSMDVLYLVDVFRSDFRCPILRAVSESRRWENSQGLLVTSQDRCLAGGNIEESFIVSIRC